MRIYLNNLLSYQLLLISYVVSPNIYAGSYKLCKFVCLFNIFPNASGNISNIHGHYYGYRSMVSKVIKNMSLIVY